MWLLFLLPACVLSMLACLRLCRAVMLTDRLEAVVPYRADPFRTDPFRTDPYGEEPPYGDGADPGQEELDLTATAYLAGGPDRVVDLTLLNMAWRGRLHLAHTGWTTVVRPVVHSELERSVIAAIGPEGQCRTTELRRELAGSRALDELAERLARFGLAVPAEVRDAVGDAVTEVTRATLATLLLFCAGLAVRPLAPVGHSDGQVAAWFALPLVLTTGTLLMARIDVYPRTRWAAPAGQSLLRGARSAQSLPAAVAVRGLRAVRDPLLRAALRATAR